MFRQLNEYRRYFVLSKTDNRWKDTELFHVYGGKYLWKYKGESSVHITDSRKSFLVMWKEIILVETR